MIMCESIYELTVRYAKKAVKLVARYYGGKVQVVLEWGNVQVNTER
jgi:hypothetical protein